MAARNREDNETADAAGLEVKKGPALSGSTIVHC